MLYLDSLLPLVNHQESPAVSLFIPGQTASLMQETLKTELENLSAGLSEHLSLSEIADFLAPITALLTDSTIWNPRNVKETEAGLAIFRSPEFFMSLDTPHAFPLQTVINGRFHLLPLLPYFEQSQYFHILDLGVQPPVLYEANAFEFSPLAIPLECSQWQQEVLALLHKTRTPLVLVGTPQERDDFLTRVTYPLCTQLHLTGPQKTDLKPLLTRQHFLQAAFLENLECLLEESRQQAWRELDQLQRVDNTLSNIREVANAAYNSRIDVLFINPDVFPTQTATFETSNESQELINMAASHTLRNGGRVYPLIPQQEGPVAAILRY